MHPVSALPSVTIVIPNWNGASHLRDCLRSIEALDYPDELLGVLVVDNGSTDESRAVVRHHRNVKLLELRENQGFAAACNVGARAAASECVAFLNNDMRVEPAWLRALVDAYDPSAGYVCVGGVILDWDGGRLDFAGGWVNFHGYAGQDHFGETVNEELIEDGRDLLFACGGSLLVARDVYLELGGFDPAYFAFFEDVDLGWRLWLAGYKVRLAARARSFHRHHGTTLAIPDHRRDLLYERNALLTLLKNVGDENLAAVLAPALFLLIQRSLLQTGSAREPFALAASDRAESETVHRKGLARLHAVSDVLDRLPDVLERRREIQRLRKRDDVEIFALFGRSFVPLLFNERYLEASIGLRAAFGLDRLFTRQRATRVLVVADGNVDRLRDVAQRVAVHADVAVISPGQGDKVLRELLAESDLVIAAGSTASAETIAAQTAGLLVVDIADDEGAANPALLARGDVILGSGPGATPIESLRAIVLEPWRWRREGADHVAVPEDVQELLRRWREHYHRGGAVMRVARSVRRLLPPTVARLVLRALRRPSVSA